MGLSRFPLILPAFLLICWLLIDAQLCAQTEDTAGPGSARKLAAVRIAENSIGIDAEMDESVWNQAEPAKDFIQSEPYSGQPAVEQTEVRILYDSENLYVGAYCFDSAGKNVTVRTMDRDFSTRGTDYFQVVLDTFHDGRNGLVFATNPAGAKLELQSAGDGSSFNIDWDVVWRVKTKVTDQGWQLEFAIPFRSIRFSPGESQSWGINFERRTRRINEESYWSPIPPQFFVYRVSLAGDLEGIRDVKQGRNLYIKPYLAVPILRQENDDVDIKPDAGFDLKYGITSGLTFDLTVNTDFSQVEADDDQINFTRFSLFFPEKREFFLENQDVFDFGKSTSVGFPGRSRRFRPPDDLIPFFSRRIGIAENEDGDGVLIPILLGARVTGRAGRYRLGMISMQDDGYGRIPSTNFFVGRLRRDILGNSEVGFLVVNKSENDGYFNRTYGADANFSFFNSLDLSTYVLNTDTPESEGSEMAGYLRAAWRTRLLSLEASHISIEDNFNAEVGFVPRVGIRKSSGEAELTFRSEGRVPWLREFQPRMRLNYITDQENALDTRETDGRLSFQFNDASRFTLSRRDTFERLVEEDDVLDEPLPPGDYSFGEYSVSYRSSSNRPVRGVVGWRTGDLYHGDLSGYNVGVDFAPSPHFGLQIDWSHTDIAFPTQDLDTDLLSTRILYSFNTNMFLKALLQYNSRDGFVASNVRFNFIHNPLSDLYVVYNESRTPLGDVIDRALILKLTYLFSF